MEQVILFILTYLCVFIIYYFYIIKKNKKRGKKKIIEVTYLVNRYKLDLDKINMKKLLLIISLVSSLDISLAVTIVLLFDSYVLKILVALILMFPIIIISYGIIGKYYQKRGLSKNE